MIPAPAGMGEGVAEAQDEAERVGRLVKHVLAFHAGDGHTKETTIALLLEHLHWQRQAGLADAASLLRRIAEDGERTGAQVTAVMLRRGAEAVDRLVAMNAATHRTFGDAT